MTIEIARSANAIYRINPAKRTEIQTRKAARGSRWQPFRICATEEQAARQILRLGSSAAVTTPKTRNGG